MGQHPTIEVVVEGEGTGMTKRKARLWLRVKAAWHELRCRECRVSWQWWIEHLAGKR